MTQTANQATTLPDVLTLAEAAAYLRVSETEIAELMRQQALPGARSEASGDSLRLQFKSGSDCQKRKTSGGSNSGPLRAIRTSTRCWSRFTATAGGRQRRKRDVRARFGYLFSLACRSRTRWAAPERRGPRRCGDNRDQQGRDPASKMRVLAEGGRLRAVALREYWLEQSEKLGMMSQ